MGLITWAPTRALRRRRRLEASELNRIQTKTRSLDKKKHKRVQIEQYVQSSEWSQGYRSRKLCRLATHKVNLTRIGAVPK